MFPFKVGKILWAIDPYDEAGNLQSSLETLKYLEEQTQAVILPVHMVLLHAIPESEEVGWEGAQKNHQQASEDSKKYLSEIYIKNLMPPQLIQAASIYPSQEIDVLLSFAKKMNVDLIVANTHGRSGVARLLRGSFVERLLERSHIPILAIGPQVKKTVPFERVLFCTHLDSRSSQIYRQVFSISSRFHSRLTVFHMLSRRERGQAKGEPTEAGQSLPLESQLIRRSRVWTSWSMKNGISIDFVFEFFFFSLW